MKNSRVLGLLAVSAAAIGISLSGCSEEAPLAEGEPVTSPNTTETESAQRVNTGADIANDPLPAAEGTLVYAFDVEGMTCSGCANSITTAVKPIDGVRAVRVSLANHRVWVSVDEASAPDMDSIASAMAAAGGYTATAADLDAPADDAVELVEEDEGGEG